MKNWMLLVNETKWRGPSGYSGGPQAYIITEMVNVPMLHCGVNTSMFDQVVSKLPTYFGVLI
jgi:hypothetical protein